MRWEIMSSRDKDFILEEAILRGWAENKVQVKRYYEGGFEVWAVEPYEEDCTCPSLVKFDPNFVLNRP